MFHFGTNHHDNGGTASCRSAVFFGFEEDGRGLGEDGRGRERKKEDLDDGGKRDSEEEETRL